MVNIGDAGLKTHTPPVLPQMKATMIKHIFLIFACLLLNGCKVGPDYHPPQVLLPDQYYENRDKKTKLIEDKELREWWKAFNDPFLDTLLETAVDQNFDYQIAIEQMDQARASYNVQFSQIFPEFETHLSASRLRTSQTLLTPSQPVGISPNQNIFQMGISALWEADVFGKLRRSAANSYRLWEASNEDVRAVKVSFISEIISIYTLVRAYQEKGDIVKERITLDEKRISIASNRFQAGLSNKQEAQQMIAALYTDQAELNRIDAALKQAVYSLSTLTGQLPEYVIDLFVIQGKVPQAEGKLPTSLPSTLLRRRADIRKAENLLAASTEEIGIAVADLFPSLTLIGSNGNNSSRTNIGHSSSALSSLFRSASSVWGIGANVNMPIFDFGKRKAAIDLQVALRNQAYYQYQKTIIAAIEETEKALSAYFQEQLRLENLEKQIEANKNILSLTTNLFDSGLIDYTKLLEVQLIYLASLGNLIDSKEALIHNLIAVYKALGGDW